MEEKFKTLRKMLGLSQEEFAVSLGLKSRGKIANIEFGKVIPDEAFLNLVCEKHNVNKEWLITGTSDEVFRPAEDETATFVSNLLGDEDNPLYDLIKSIMRTYESLDEPSKKVLKSFAKDLKDNMKDGE